MSSTPGDQQPPQAGGPPPQQPMYYPPQPVPTKKKHRFRNFVVLPIVALFVLAGIISAATSGSSKNKVSTTAVATTQSTTASDPTTQPSTSNAPATTTTVTNPAPATTTKAAPSYSPKEVTYLKTARAAKLGESDTDLVKTGKLICQALQANDSLKDAQQATSDLGLSKSGQSKLIVASSVAFCPGETSTAKTPVYTVSQQNAITSAKGYLSDGEGFSRLGLIDQLSSSSGEGFSHSDAVFAVDHIKVDYNKEAVISAKGYLSDGEGFSRSGLIEQLSSSSGEQFTHSQAVYAANHVGF